MGRKARYVEKIVAVGECPECGKAFTSPAVCTHAVCDCSSIVEVPLHPVLVLSKRFHAKIKKVADLAGVSVEDLVNAIISEAAKEVLEGKLTIKYKI